VLISDIDRSNDACGGEDNGLSQTTSPHRIADVLRARGRAGRQRVDSLLALGTSEERRDLSERTDVACCRARRDVARLR